MVIRLPIKALEKVRDRFYGSATEVSVIKTCGLYSFLSLFLVRTSVVHAIYLVDLKGARAIGVKYLGDNKPYDLEVHSDESMCIYYRDRYTHGFVLGDILWFYGRDGNLSSAKLDCVYSKYINRLLIKYKLRYYLSQINRIDDPDLGVVMNENLNHAYTKVCGDIDSMERNYPRSLVLHA